MPEIEKEYISTGKLKYVFLDFPLDFHKQAFKAAEAAHCAGEQGKYWDMHDKIFADQKAMEPKDLSDQKAMEPKYLSEYAKVIGIDTAKFQQCLDSGKYAEAIKKDRTEGQKAGATGAPGFFLGYTDPAKPGTVKATKMIKGAVPYAKFKETIDSLLSPKK